MTNLFLCTGKIAKTPFCLEEVGLRIYTIEEFCYRVLTKQDDMDENIYSPAFVDFVRKELELPELADELQQILDKKKGYAKFITTILESCDYAGAAEIKKVNEVLSHLEQKTPLELEKLRADKLLEKRRFQAAIVRYEGMIARETFSDNVLLGNIYNNLGTAYAGLFLYEKAAECYRDAYRLNRNVESYHAYMHAIRYVSADAEYGKDIIYFKEDQAKALKKELFDLLDSGEARIARNSYYRLRELLEQDRKEEFAAELGAMIGAWKREYIEIMGEEA